VEGAPPATTGLGMVAELGVEAELELEAELEVAEVPPESLVAPRTAAAAGVARIAKLHSAEPRARTRKTPTSFVGLRG
jgi:hypothetical protein